MKKNKFCKYCKHDGNCPFQDNYEPDMCPVCADQEDGDD